MADQTQTSGNTTSPPDQLSHIRLACQACQRKKIKCDRTFPCGQCLKSNLDCIPSARKRRARHAGKRAVDGELRNRIAKLESLVESLSGDNVAESDKPQEATESSPAQTRGSVEIESPQVGRYVASTFWSSLSMEMTALREALEDEDDEDELTGETPETSNSSPNKTDVGNTFEHDLIICPPGRIYVMPGVMEDPPTHVKAHLNDIFLQNVERLIKIFHTPTIKDLLEHDAPYLGHLPGSPQHDALKRVAWFSALNTLSETEAFAITGQNKAELLPKYRRYVEILLSQCDVINTNDLATLQCFLLFTAVCRSTDSSRRTWTILALLVRIAQAMLLNHDDSRATPYIRELRRRLWHYVRFLDKFGALDRGTVPLIGPSGHTTPLPTCTDDDMFGPDSKEIPVVTGRLCDMSFALMCMEACNTIESLLAPESKEDVSWEQRYQLALELKKRVESEYLVHCDPQNPWHRLHHAIGRSMSTAMLLRAVRPMQRHASSLPPPVGCPYVLQLAVDNLQAVKTIVNQPEAWRWMRWVPWHSLACALAGLCSIRGTALADEAWTLVEPTFKFCSQYVADSQGGMLWRPIVKLYKKAHAFRDADPRRQSLQPALDQQLQSDSLLSATEQLPLATSTSLPLTGGMDQPANGFSQLGILPFPSLLDSNVQYPTTLLTPRRFSMTDSFDNGDWGDWGQLMDEYADPLALGDITMDNMAMDNWPWAQTPTATFGTT